MERVVDLVTTDYHILAKRAKDAGATLVLMSLIVTALVWIFTLLVAFELV
ncbi:MAG: diacylglycerol kinase [Sulfurimonas sp.]|nr:diacylglycerol kinase [Sulfurimonas sp.]